MVRNARVLMADGDVGLCRIMSLVLGRSGYSVAIAEDGASAVAAAMVNSYDIILLDVRSPVMGGVNTYKALKQIRPEAVVVMMTAFTVGGLARDVLGEAPHAVIYKPVEIDRLTGAIEVARSADRGGLVLIVDDEPGAHATLGDTLTSRGYRLARARSGPEAVARAKEAGEAVLFVTGKEAPMNALETYLAVREANPHAVAVVMTYCHLQASQVAEQALRGDAYPCLQKPFSIEELLTLAVEVERGRLSVG